MRYALAFISAASLCALATAVSAQEAPIYGYYRTAPVGSCEMISGNRVCGSPLPRHPATALRPSGRSEPWSRRRLR